jgi:hypothetical protein
MSKPDISACSHGLPYDKRLWSGYDLTADGRFVVAVEADEQGSGNQINVVLHWFDELKQELPK